MTHVDELEPLANLVAPGVRPTQRSEAIRCARRLLDPHSVCGRYEGAIVARELLRVLAISEDA